MYFGGTRAVSSALLNFDGLEDSTRGLVIQANISSANASRSGGLMGNGLASFVGVSSRFLWEKRHLLVCLMVKSDPL